MREKENKMRKSKDQHGRFACFGLNIETYIQGESQQIIHYKNEELQTYNHSLSSVFQSYNLRQKPAVFNLTQNTQNGCKCSTQTAMRNA